MEDELRLDNKGFNALSMMTDSGARGSKDQSKQRRFIGQNKCEGMCEKSE